jgi:tetratricopeptide (TPR) repeat protein
MISLQTIIQRSLLFCFLLLSSCATVSDDALHHPPEPAKDEIPATLTVEMPDSSCSYFYLLWGTHAENNKLYQEAEEALEKALICDPNSKYILRRLPVLLLRMGKPQGAAEWLRKAIKQYPDDTQDRLFLARLAIRNDDIEEAIQLYRDVLALTPDDETLLLRIGFLQSQQNLFLEAEQTLQEALLVNPESLFAHLYLARLAKRTKNHKKAEEHYKRSLQLNWSVELALEVADFYGSLEQYTKVEQQYRTVFTKHPEDSRGGLGLVHVLLLQNKEKEAFSVLKELRASSNDPDAIDIVTARLYLRSKDLEKAATFLEPLTAEDGLDEAIYMLSVIRYQQKQEPQALTLLRKIKADSTYHEDGLSLQVRIFMEKKQFKTAIALLRDAITSNKASSPELYTLLASLYMEQGLFQNGYSTLDAALTVHPDSTKVYFEYGLLLEKENKRELALQRMTALLELDPEHAEALNYVGYTWADMGINLEQALSYIQKAIELKPGNGYIRDSLGWVYYRMGELALATKEIMKALQMEPDDPYIHEHLGDIYLKLGDNVKAQNAYKEALRLFKNEEKRTQMQDQINAL